MTIPKSNAVVAFKIPVPDELIAMGDTTISVDMETDEAIFINDVGETFRMPIADIDIVYLTGDFKDEP